MSSKKDNRSSGNDADAAEMEPRFAKAFTDRRFAKIGRKDRTVHLDSRFKHIVKDRKFAIAGMSFSCSFLLQFPSKG
jgi:hypothetical protein